MRVVAGVLRGRRLIAPAVGRGPVTTRPTTDKVRESVFNALSSRGALEGRQVLDLFAGSGALGIEALSRGAAHCTFVERDARAVEALRANLRQLGLEGCSQVVVADVERWMANAPAVDLALVDPPYAFDRWTDLLEAIDAHHVVAESDRPLPATARWTVERTRRYGRTWVTWFEQVP